MKLPNQIKVWAAVSFILISAGSVLGFTLSYWFLMMIPIGIFGPGLMRRVGLLHDVDEFILCAQDSSAWTAFGVVSLLGILLFILERTSITFGATSSDRILVMLIFGFVVYAACYLFRFWNGKKAGQILLLMLAGAWSVFIVLSKSGNLVAMGMESLVVISPLIALAVLCHFFPRVGGVFCLLTATGSVAFFNLLDFSRGTNLFVISAITLPLIVVSIGMFVKTKDVFVKK